MFDKDITIVNKWFNKETKSNEYKVNHIHGFWNASTGINISKTQLVKDDGLKVLILMSEPGYVFPNEFKETGKGWTLQNDDYLIKGIAENVNSITDVKDNYECMKITKIHLKDYGSIDMQHYKVIGE